MRGTRSYRTGDERLDNALNRVYMLTSRDPEDWRVPGEQIEGWLIEMIKALEKLPPEHALNRSCPNLFQNGSHLRWSPDDSEKFYSKVISRLHPALDEIEDAPQGTKPIDDPLLADWRRRAESASDLEAKLRLCEEISNSDNAHFELARTARKAVATLKQYRSRKQLLANETSMIDKAFYLVRITI